MVDIRKIIEFGLEILKKIDSKNEKVIKWKNWLRDYGFISEYPDDPHAWLTLVLALSSVDSGNYGVGSLLVDSGAEIVSLGHNLVYSPYFRSDLHAEMVVVNNFEEKHPEITTLEGYKLYTSLESCPMCLVRLISSGINSILHVSSDPLAGMVQETKNLPTLWKDLSERQTFSKANCSEELSKASIEIMLINADELLEILRKRSSPSPPLKSENKVTYKSIQK